MYAITKDRLRRQGYRDGIPGDESGNGRQYTVHSQGTVHGALCVEIRAILCHLSTPSASLCQVHTTVCYNSGLACLPDVFASLLTIIVLAPRGGKFCWATDGAFCKPAAGFPGQLLNLTGLDAQGSPVTIGYALVLRENTDAYEWFFRQAASIHLEDDRTFADVLNAADSVMFSDRQKGLRSAVKSVFPECHHLLCCHHLLVGIQTTEA